MPGEVEIFLRENKRLLFSLVLVCVFAFSSGYVFGLEGRTTKASVEGKSKVINYQKGYKEGEQDGYKKGFALARKKEEKVSYQESYKKAYLEQFEKAGIRKPKEVSFP